MACTSLPILRHFGKGLKALASGSGQVLSPPICTFGASLALHQPDEDGRAGDLFSLSACGLIGWNELVCDAANFDS